MDIAKFSRSFARVFLFYYQEEKNISVKKYNPFSLLNRDISKYQVNMHNFEDRNFLVLIIFEKVLS